MSIKRFHLFSIMGEKSKRLSANKKEKTRQKRNAHKNTFIALAASKFKQQDNNINENERKMVQLTFARN